MARPLQILLCACLIAVSGCSKRVADFRREVVSPSGKATARFAGYQPRGTIEGYLTVSFSLRLEEANPQLTLGHMLRLQAGWLDDNTFAFVYDLLDQRRFASPVYLTGEVSSAVQIIACNRRYVDCRPVVDRLRATHSIVMQQFPEGSWPVVP